MGAKVFATAKLGIPVTVQHIDVRDCNVRADEESGEMRVFDWEMGFVGHPLTNLTH